MKYAFSGKIEGIGSEEEMTREEAIKILEFEKQGVFKSSTTKEALDIAIKALQEYEKYFPTPTEDSH